MIGWITSWVSNPLIKINSISLDQELLRIQLISLENELKKINELEAEIMQIVIKYFLGTKHASIFLQHRS